MSSPAATYRDHTITVDVDPAAVPGRRFCATWHGYLHGSTNARTPAAARRKARSIIDYQLDGSLWQQREQWSYDNGL